jgi:hypothetical protein
VLWHISNSKMPPLGSSGSNHSPEPDTISTTPASTRTEKDISNQSPVPVNKKDSNSKLDVKSAQAETCVRARIYSFLGSWELLVMFLTIARKEIYLLKIISLETDFSRLAMAGFTIIQPYQQTRRAELDCGPVCYGSMTSTSSFLGLIGAPLVGALSDQKGRRFALAIGCLAGI